MPIMSTTDIQPKEVIPYWKDLICKTYVPIECSFVENRPFTATIKTATLGRTQLSRVSSMPINYERTGKNISRCKSDDYIVKLLTKGKTHIQQAGRSTVICPGDLCLFDTARPYTLAFPETYDAVVLKIPRAELDARLPLAENVSAMRVAAQGCYTQLAATMVLSTANLVGQENTYSPKLAAHMIDLISMAFDEFLGDQKPSDSRYMRIVNQAQDLMSDHLFDSEFDVSSVPKTIGVSSRTLSRAFAQNNMTPVKWMWGQRLDAAHELLANGRSQTVSDAAMKCGFNDFSHFSRVFKTRFGRTASSFLMRN